MDRTGGGGGGGRLTRASKTSSPYFSLLSLRISNRQSRVS